MRHPITDDAFHGGEPIPAARPRDTLMIDRFEPAGRAFPSSHLPRVRVAGAMPSPPPCPLRRPARKIHENER